MTKFMCSSATAAVGVLALIGTVRASPIADDSPQQLHDLWAAAAAATPSHEPDAPISAVTVTLTGTPVKPTPAVVATTPAIAAITARPRLPPFLPPWLSSVIGAGRTLPPGWGTGPLTAGAVCGPYTLPVNLPFSPPCPYSTTKVTTTTAKETEPTPPTEPAPPPTAPTIPFPPAVPISGSTTIYPSGHSTPTVSAPSASPPVSSVVSSTLSQPKPPPPASSSLATPTPRPSETTTTPIIKTLPPTTQPVVSPVVGSPTQVIVTVSVTLRPDPPYTPGPRGAGPATTLATVRRE